MKAFVADKAGDLGSLAGPGWAGLAGITNRSLTSLCSSNYLGRSLGEGVRGAGRG